MALVMPSIYGVMRLSGDNPEKTTAAIVGQMSCLVVCLLFARAAKRLPSLSLILSAMMGVTLFAITQFAPSETRLLSYIAALVLLAITIWSALEFMGRKNAHTGSYIK